MYEGPFRTNVNRLSDALGVLRSMHVAEPDHQVMTVFLCLKGPFVEGNGPAELDALVDAFGKSIASPNGDLLYRPSNPRNGVPWPALDALAGKFVFAVTGDHDALVELDQWQRGRDCSVFLAPELDNLDGLGSGADYVTAFKAAWPDAGFANINFHTWRDTPALADVADRLAEVRIVSRAYPRTLMVPVVDRPVVDCLNDADEWRMAKQAGFHHIATNQINTLAAPYACTNAQNGWPFERRGDSGGMLAAPGRRAVLRVDVDSGDIFGDADSFAFAFSQETLDTANRRFIYSIASPGSRVPDEWAKGALMARASLDPDADYFALVRPADGHRFQVQWRKQGPTDSRYKEIFLGDNPRWKQLGFTIAPDTLVFGRIDLLNNGFRAAAYVAIDWRGAATEWIFLDEEMFDRPLVFHGLAASSHGGGPIAFQFGDLGTTPPLPVLTVVGVGDGVALARSQVNAFPTST